MKVFVPLNGLLLNVGMLFVGRAGLAFHPDLDIIIKKMKKIKIEAYPGVEYVAVVSSDFAEATVVIGILDSDSIKVGMAFWESFRFITDVREKDVDLGRGETFADYVFYRIDIALERETKEAAATVVDNVELLNRIPGHTPIKNRSTLGDFEKRENRRKKKK